MACGVEGGTHKKTVRFQLPESSEENQSTKDANRLGARALIAKEAKHTEVIRVPRAKVQASGQQAPGSHANTHQLIKRINEFHSPENPPKKIKESNAKSIDGKEEQDESSASKREQYSSGEESESLADTEELVDPFDPMDTRKLRPSGRG